MKNSFFIATAWNNIKKNYRFYIPHVLTGTGLLACFYIVLTLTKDGRIAKTRGGSYVSSFMVIGSVVIGLLSIILILYANSFLMKQRKREYGLYNILGMEKKHVCRVLAYETLISGAASLLFGTLLGILFYKLCSLLICSLLQTDIIIGFYFISAKTIIPAILFFFALYLLSYIINVIDIFRMKPVELLSSKSTGEKEPKIKWVIFVIGLITLVAGYLLAILIESPLEAILFFFVAVILVIIGTYFLFTAGSIFVLKCMKKNKKYYYSKKHMPSVSGLLYRMKQNAVGLASICILSTGVLIMASTTISLYSGIEETLAIQYPQDLYFSITIEERDEGKWSASCEKLSEIVDMATKDNEIEIDSSKMQTYLEVAYVVKDNNLYTKKDVSEFDIDDISDFCFITQDEYYNCTGNKINLGENEIALCNINTTIGTTKFLNNYLMIGNLKLNIVELIPNFPIQSALISSVSGYGVVIPNQSVMDYIYDHQLEGFGEAASTYTNRLAIDFKDKVIAEEKGKDLDASIMSYAMDYTDSLDIKNGGVYTSLDTFWDSKEMLISMDGTLLFLGIILGIVCLFATVLIIYYKQISEGYEDRERYQIMKKIGMSDDEVRGTIKTQTLLVFFLPLITAAIHVAFAFPMLNKMLKVVLLARTSLFVACTLITFAVFAAVYVLIYSLTAKTYYKIVK